MIAAGLIFSGQAQAKGGGSDHAGGNGHGHGHEHNSADVAGGEKLGSLNAAHASETARAHAASNSQVGKIASYERSVQNGDIAAAAADLAGAANKAIVEPVVHAVNELLGIDDAPVATGGTVHDTEADVAAHAGAD
jgi:hypothetical protein